jgi:predicted CXXCH cytochrome family protein
MRGRLSLLTILLVLAAVLTLRYGPQVALSEHKDVASTAHNVATAGMPVCIYCHIPRDAAGQLLWPGGEPDPEGKLAGQKRLCFSCHDGTVTRERAYVFNPERPDHVRTAGVTGQDCDRCHDAHGTQNKKFLRVPANANFCWNCHFRAGPADHPIGVDAAAAGMHPLDTQFDPKVRDYSGTRLWNEDGTGPGNRVMCLTCHNPHGGQPGTLILTVAYDAGGNSYEGLCRSCHVDK